MKLVGAIIGALITLGVGAVGVQKYSEHQKELLRERAARKEEEQKVTLMAWEAENARREKAAIESASRRELDAERTELRRLSDYKTREARRAREQALVEEARQMEARRRHEVEDRQQPRRDLEAELAASPWGKIKRGMIRDEVRQVLGKPKWVGGGASGDTWMYLENTTLGCGSITFLGGIVESFRDPFHCQAWHGWPQDWPGLDAESQAAMAKARADNSGAPSYPIGVRDRR